MRRKHLLLFSAWVLPFAILAEGQPDGAALYATHCGACHQPEGEGVVGMVPALAGTLAKRVATAEGQACVAQILVSGMSGPIVSQGQRFNANMPSFAAQPDADLAAVMNHVLGRLNASPLRFSPEAFAAARGRALSPVEVRKWRERVAAQVEE